MRVACLCVPLFPLAALLRSQPELGREALIIVTGDGNAARVVAATRIARKAGIRPGLTLPQARALLPGLVARSRDEECERAAQQNLLEIADSFSPRVEDGRDGVTYLDLEGLERHFRGDRPRSAAGRSTSDPELLLGQALIDAARAAGLLARVGIAASKLAARVAAEIPDSPAVVPAGEEAAFLAPLPLSRLSPEAEVAVVLERWGIRSIGDFARLPKNEVASRLGRPGQELHVRARGMDPRPLVPCPAPQSFREGMDLEWPLVQLEPFLFVAASALGRLCQRLETRGWGCARLDMSFRLEPYGHHERSIRLPAPTRDAKTLLTLVRLDLEAQPPVAPLAGFTFVAHPDAPREAQLSLLGPASISPDRLATTLARLFALLGPGRVGSPRRVDGHRPERFALVEYAPPPPPRVHRPPPRGRGLLAVRALRPPVPLEVVTETRTTPGRHDPAAAPRSIRALARDSTDRRPRIEGEIKVASGPWVLEEGWWSESPVERDYWDVELTDGGVYRIFRERRSGEWFGDGIYD